MGSEGSVDRHDWDDYSIKLPTPGSRKVRSRSCKTKDVCFYGPIHRRERRVLSQKRQRKARQAHVWGPAARSI